MRGLSSILSRFRSDCNKFNNTGARMVYSIYHLTLNNFKIAVVGVETLRFWWKVNKSQVNLASIETFKVNCYYTGIQPII